MSDKDLQTKAAEFFRSPNGTVFCERCSSSTYLYAVKLPLGSDDRFSMVLSEHTYRDQFVTADGVFPGKDFSLSLDSYVDNHTGRRIVCGYSYFEYDLDYKDGTLSLHAAINEVEQEVANRIYALPDNDLVLLAITNGQDPTPSMTLSDNERKKIMTNCERAFVRGSTPDLDDRTSIDLRINANSSHAQFAIAYLQDKEAYIQEQVKLHAPKLVLDILHHNTRLRTAEQYMAQIQASPSLDLLKERDIRAAIVDKASVWATFGKGTETLRMSIPTGMFRDSSAELNSWSLTDKDRKRLEEFIREPGKQRWLGRDPHVSDIVALDYKNKVLYRDEAFYDQHRAPTQNQASFDSILQDATTRAASQQAQTTAPREPSR